MSRSRLSSVARRALAGPGMPCAGQRLIVALSGGADSVALLDVLDTLSRTLGFELVAAHLDHQLRPESADDAAFCRHLCRTLGVPFVSAVADVRARAARERGGLEQAARRERYAFLRRVRREQGATAVALAHTRDDQAETVLLRLVRGAGARGLASMRKHSRDLLRPLLEASRQDVLAHLAERGLQWREDASNVDRRFARNRVRHEVLPQLELHLGGHARRSLARAAALLADDDRALEARAARAFARAGVRRGAGLVLALAALRRVPRAIARRVVRRGLRACGGLRGVAAVHVERILALCATPSPSGRRVSLPGGREASFRFDELYLGPRAQAAASFATSLSVPGCVLLPDGRALSACSGQGPARRDGRVAVLALDGPLEVRTRRAGDRVHVRGGSRSLKRVFMDARVPAELRGAWPVVAAAGRVIWVPGIELGPPLLAAGRRLVRLELLEAAGRGVSA